MSFREEQLEIMSDVIGKSIVSTLVLEKQGIDVTKMKEFNIRYLEHIDRMIDLLNNLKDIDGKA